MLLFYVQAKLVTSFHIGSLFYTCVIYDLYLTDLNFVPVKFRDVYACNCTFRCLQNKTPTQHQLYGDFLAR